MCHVYSHMKRIGRGEEMNKQLLDPTALTPLTHAPSGWTRSAFFFTWSQENTLQYLHLSVCGEKRIDLSEWYLGRLVSWGVEQLGRWEFTVTLVSATNFVCAWIEQRWILHGKGIGKSQLPSWPTAMCSRTTNLHRSVKRLSECLGIRVEPRVS